jgi:hypothetical protein
METLPGFGLELRKGDHMLSFDIKSGYRHFRLAPLMRDYFLFHYAGRFFKCVSLPFGWGRSPLWFTQLMKPMVKAMRAKGWRVLAYLDDFLIVPSRCGCVARRRDCARAAVWIEKLLTRLGVLRHPLKGEWCGSTRVEHLGFVIDSRQMRFYLAPRKMQRVRDLARALQRQSNKGRRWVDAEKLRSFLGTCVSLTIAFPFARYYSRSMYDDLSMRRQRARRAARGGARVRLSHQSLRDLAVWRKLAGPECDGRPIFPATPDGIMHTDAADVGYGGTLDSSGEPGEDGVWHEQGIWSWRDRAEPISVRELRAIRMLIQGALGERSATEGLKVLRLCIDNTACVHVTRAFVSSSRAMMRELRRLKRALDESGITIQAEWLPSAANRFADALSRRFSSSDLTMRHSLLRSVADGLRAPAALSRNQARLGENIAYTRRRVLEEIGSHWEREQTRVLCPPVDLIPVVLRKIQTTRAPVILLFPDWSTQSWYATAIRLASRTTLLSQKPAECWIEHRSLNPAWRVRLAEYFLPSAGQSPTYC